MKTCPTIFILLSIAAASWSGITLKEFYRSIPKTVKEWESRHKDEFYNRKTLYEYINGGAELYLAYDFKQVFSRRYLGPGSSEIVLDIYDMGTSRDAFGIFSIEHQDEEIGIGQDSEYGGGLLRFWKGCFFISIMAMGDEQNAKPIMIQLAQSVAQLITTEGSKPDLLKALPDQGLVAKRIRFFHTAAILNRQYFLAEQNILQLSKNTDCILAKYKTDGGSAYMLLVQYPNDTLANNAYRTFLAAYMPEAKASGIVQVENKSWAMVNRRANVLILVLEANSKDFGMNLMSSTKLSLN